MLLGTAFGRHAQRAAGAFVLAGALGGLAAIGGGSGAAAASAHRSPALSGLAQAYAASSHGLDVLPFPGTLDAPPGTPIDFPAIAPAQVVSVKAVGSSSGVHPGRLSAQPDNNGTQFAPSPPFAPGERVSVTAVLRTRAAGAASGAPGSKRLRFSFTIARAGSVLTRAGTLLPHSGGLPATPDTLGVTAASQSLTRPSSSTTHSFVTEPQFHAPVIVPVGSDSDTAAGDVFLDAQNTGQNGAYSLRPNFDLLWYHPTSGTSGSKGPAAFNVRVQTYQGRPTLTYWEGHLNIPPGDGTGVGVMLNEQYQRIHTVTAGAGYQSDGVDLHEFTVAPDGKDAWVTVFAPVRTSSGTVIDCIAQEIDIATNRVVWEWNALNHVRVSDSYAPPIPGQAFDFFHMNSIQDLGDGHIIISARDMWAVYSINKRTGKIDWVLGGRHPNFWMGSGTHFYWQHDAELHRNGLLTVYDDGSGYGYKNESQSRALSIGLNFSNWHASLLHAYLHRPPVLAGSMGNTQLLFNHNMFVGWGGAPTFSEYSPSGAQIYDAWFRSPVDSYRAYRFNDFVGQPAGPPAIAVRKSSRAGQDNVFMSWNGSSLVARWRVLAGSSPSSLRAVKEVAWAGFETEVQAPRAGYFEVQALGSGGNVLPHGSSPVVHGQ